MSSAAAALSIGDVDTLLGRIIVAASDEGLVALSLPGQPTDRFLSWLDERIPGPRLMGEDAPAGALVRQAQRELRAYFERALATFTIPVAPRGTAFQQLVWRAVGAIPYGETRTYGAIAASLDRPRAARAVGHANGANPLPIVIPCHRIIGSDGELTGYAGGLTMKRWLLDHERAAARLTAR